MVECTALFYVAVTTLGESIINERRSICGGRDRVGSPLWLSVALRCSRDHVGRVDSHIEGDVVRVANDNHVQHQAAGTNASGQTENSGVEWSGHLHRRLLVSRLGCL